jgi:hypothetical protein
LKKCFPFENRVLSDMMGVETPLPPVAMDAAAPEGAQSKNPDGFFFSQYSPVRRLSPHGGSLSSERKR